MNQRKINLFLTFLQMAPTSALLTLSHVLQKSLEMPACLNSTFLSYIADNTTATTKIKFICHCFFCLFIPFISLLKQ